MEGSEFQGRSFIRSDYSGNFLLDDISSGFTGIAKTFTMTSGSSNITGINTDFGVILLNNTFQNLPLTTIIMKLVVPLQLHLLVITYQVLLKLIVRLM